jgi:DNA helicase HerA-like ATPase
MSKNAASIVAVMGASGSGKSLYIKGELRRTRPRRLIVWDALGEYGEFGTPAATLGEVLAAAKAATFRRIFRPSADPEQARKQFDVLCRIVFAAGDTTLVAEELAFVTSPSYAPPGWSECTLKGRHRALKIYGASQRPASIDKHFFGNATEIRTGRLNFARDVKTLADVLQVPAASVQSLQPLDYISRNMANGKISTGRLKIPGA